MAGASRMLLLTHPVLHSVQIFPNYGNSHQAPIDHLGHLPCHNLVAFELNLNVALVLPDVHPAL